MSGFPGCSVPADETAALAHARLELKAAHVRAERAERAAVEAEAEQHRQLDEQQERMAQLTSAVQSVVADAEHGAAELQRLKETKEREVRAAVAGAQAEAAASLAKVREEHSVALERAVEAAFARAHLLD